MEPATLTRFVTRCPACDGELCVTRLSCTHCQLQIEGQIDVPPLLRLPPTDLSFVTDFVRASGSLKAMAAKLGQSYPTIRNRLDDIIARLQRPGTDSLEAKRHAILDAIAKGDLTVKEGAKALKELEP